MIKDLHSLDETKHVCQFIFHLSLFKHQWQFTMPQLHSDLLERLIVLTSSTVAAVSKRSVLKQTIKTMNAAGVLAPEEGHLGTWKTKYGCGSGGRRVRTVSTGKENSVSWMQDRLVVMGVVMGLVSHKRTGGGCGLLIAYMRMGQWVWFHLFLAV